MLPYAHLSMKTLGEVLDADYALCAFCLNERCPEWRRLDVPRLVARHGRDFPIADLAPLLRCKRCRSEAKVTITRTKPAAYQGGPLTVGNYLEPGDVVETACRWCDHKGRFTRDEILRRFGPDMVLPEARLHLANCDRKNSTRYDKRCGVYYRDVYGRQALGAARAIKSLIKWDIEQMERRRKAQSFYE